MRGKRFFALFTAAALTVGLAACVPSNPQEDTSTGGGQGGKLFEEPVTISIMLPSSGNEPYNEDWLAWKYIQEATGAQLDMRTVPTDYQTKIAMAFASPETLPDLMVFDHKPFVDEYAGQGALLAIEDYEKDMPHWTAFWNSVDSAEKERLFEIRQSADGKTYWPSRYGSQDIIGLKTWMYRKDIFEKHGLEMPKTYDELYEVAKKLKELYPDSYPISTENFFYNIGQTVGPQFKPYFMWNVYYDFDAGEWRFGATEDTMLEMITVFKKFYDEQLILPNYVTIEAREFNEAVCNSRTFIFPHWQVRLGILNNTMKDSEPEFNIAPMYPPVANAQSGIPMMSKYNVDTNGYVLCNTNDDKRIANTVKFFDWLYSDQACELLSWGKEGETYEIKDGKKQFILQEGEDIRNKYGFQTYGLGQRLDPEVVLYYYTSGTREDMEFMMEHTEEAYNPASWIAFNTEEQNVRADVGLAIDTYAQMMISKFLIGQEPLSNWDAFVKTIKEMGVDDLLSVYQSAYDRVK